MKLSRSLTIGDVVYVVMDHGFFGKEAWLGIVEAIHDDHAYVRDAKRDTVKVVSRKHICKEDMLDRSKW